MIPRPEIFAMIRSGTPALSIWQPYAGLIVIEVKGVENRGWRCPERYVGQVILVHAGLRVEFEGEAVDAGREMAGEVPGGAEMFEARVGAAPDAFRLGGIVGTARVRRCLKGYASPWANPEPGTWHWVLDRQEACEFVPCRGMQGFFHPRPEPVQGNLLECC